MRASCLSRVTCDARRVTTLRSTPEQISWGIGALGMPGATACVLAMSQSTFVFVTSKNKLLLPSLFPDDFCSYGGLVDVLEVLGGGPGSEGRIPSAFYLLRRSKTVRRCSSARQLERLAGARLITSSHQPQPHACCVSLVGQIAKNVYQCTVIGSCRTRKCATPHLSHPLLDSLAALPNPSPPRKV